MKSEEHFREQLTEILKGHAHMSFDEAVADFPPKFINTFPPNVGYTFWHLLEHIRFTQRDIIEFINDKKYKEPKWPEEYWPKKTAKATRKEFDTSVRTIKRDLKKIIKMVNDPAIDLSQKVPYGSGQTYLREALLVADHNAYHIGEFAILRQVVKAWVRK